MAAVVFDQRTYGSVGDDAERALVAALRADGRNGHVVDGIIMPMLRHIRPARLNPLLLLRRMRDEHSLARLPPEALGRMANLLELDPPRSWHFSGRYVMAALEIGGSTPMQRIAPGAPSYAAWQADYRRRGFDNVLATVERSSGFVEFTTWPPRHPLFPFGRGAS